MLQLKSKRASGFTIVELLIVIVVIGVLAAITIVAYNGVQERATNSSALSAANQVLKLTRRYLATESGFPHTARSCATESPCYYGGLNAVNATFRTNITKVGDLPGGVPTWSTTYGGVLYDYSAGRTYNGQPSTVVIMYFLKGANKDCGREVTNGITSPMTSSTNPYTQVIGSTTFCAAPMPGY
jgi:prepilin-type N-terminal cleavage/methylation domain-containing protein